MVALATMLASPRECTSRLLDQPHAVPHNCACQCPLVGRMIKHKTQHQVEVAPKPQMATLASKMKKMAPQEGQWKPNPIPRPTIVHAIHLLPSTQRTGFEDMFLLC